MSRRTRVQREWLIEQVELSGQASASISEANRWLITGPDTRPKAERNKLWNLLAFHRYTRNGVMDMSRDAWLEKAPTMGFSLILKYVYSPKLITQMLYKDHVLLDWLPVRR